MSIEEKIGSSCNQVNHSSNLFLRDLCGLRGSVFSFFCLTAQQLKSLTANLVRFFNFFPSCTLGGMLPSCLRGSGFCLLQATGYIMPFGYELITPTIDLNY